MKQLIESSKKVTRAFTDAVKGVNKFSKEMEDVEHIIHANDSYRTRQQKDKARVKANKGKQEKVAAHYSPDGGRTVYTFKSKAEAKRRIPFIEARYAHG